MSNPYEDPNHDDERPQPRYGAYSPRSEGSTQASGEQTSSDAEPPPGGQSPQGGQHNPYNQPTWGQPGGDWGQGPGQPSPYGAPGEPGHQPGAAQPVWQQPAQPAPAGYPGTPVTQKPKRPTTMVLAMVLMLAAAGLSLAWGIYVLVTMQAQDAEALMSEQMREVMVQSFQNDPQLQDLSPEEALDFVLLSFGVFALIWSFVLVVIYVTMAFVGTMAGNAGRVLATIWLAASVLFLLLGHDVGAFLLIGATVLLSIAALILLWLPASSSFVRQRRAFKEARRRSAYAGYPGGFGGGDPGQQPGPYAQAPQPEGSQPPPGQGPGPQGPYGGNNPYGQNPRGPQ